MKHEIQTSTLCKKYSSLEGSFTQQHTYYNREGNNNIIASAYDEYATAIIMHKKMSQWLPLLLIRAKEAGKPREMDNKKFFFPSD